MSHVTGQDPAATPEPTPQPAVLENVDDYVAARLAGEDGFAPATDPAAPPEPETPPASDPTPPADAATAGPDPKVSEAARTLNEHKRNKQSAQERIDDLTYHRRRAEEAAAAEKERADRLERELAEIRAGRAPAGTPTTPTPSGPEAPLGQPEPPTFTGDDPNDPEPTIEQFLEQEDPHLALAKATGAWSARKEFRRQKQQEDYARAQAQAREASQRAAEEAKRVIQSHVEREAAYRKVRPDYDTVISSSTAPMTPIMAREIVGSEHGPAMAVYLAEHPDEASQIAALPPDRQLKAMGALEVRVQSAPRTGSAAQATPPTRSHVPISPVGTGSPAATAVSPDQEDPDAYLARRFKEMGSH